MSGRRPAKRWWTEEAVRALVISGLTVGMGLILSEFQSRLGWVPLATALATTLVIFGIATFLIERPLEARIVGHLEEVAKLHRSGSINWLRDTNQLADYERQCGSSEIWLFTADLLDDSPEGPFAEVVREKLTKGTRYVYFVPDRPEIRARVQVLQNRYPSTARPEFVYLPDNFFFLVPHLDIVIYDPLSPSGRCGFMGLPVPDEKVHYHAAVSSEFIDRLTGTILERYKKKLKKTQ